MNSEASVQDTSDESNMSPLPTHDDLLDESTDSDGEESSNRPSKRQKRLEGLDDLEAGSERPLPLQNYAVIYRVRCSLQQTAEEDHSEHQALACYQDEPRLFAKDTRASALRGRRHIPDLETYLGIQPLLYFVVYKDYDCHRYHTRRRKNFESSAPESIDRASFLRLKPWFHVLPRDTNPASPLSERISILEEGFLSGIERLASRDPENLGIWDTEVNLRARYNYFYQTRVHIRKLFPTMPDSSDTTAVGIRLLLEYFESAYGHQWAYADDLFNQGLVTADTFSKLFFPGELIVRAEDGVNQAYMIDKVEAFGGSRTLINCWRLTFDGALHRTNANILVKRPGNKKDVVAVQTLDAWPLRLDKSGLQDRLATRGIEFWRCRTKRLVGYNGPQGSNFEVQTGSFKFMIDVDTHRTLHPSKYPEFQSNESDLIDMSKEEPPSGKLGLLMPAVVPGFGFHDKKWRSLQVDHIRSVAWNENAFKRLVLKASKKELIQALVTVHLDNNKATDVIEGKGAGLIMLLHGPPGTGKTLTAETVAELANKPLYRVTCGDIGTDAEAVEKYLESALYLGTIWDCVVLLDEADVFLEERTQNDMARNALVSVFLRVLEYFNGILLLTSNRVGLFDEAFKSRMQLAIRYPSLDEEGRAKIWEAFFKALHRAEADMDFEDLNDNVKSLARKQLNGRQIRNVIKTARQLAAFRMQKFGMPHLECAIEVVEEFEQYLVDTRGSDDYYARQQRVR